MKTGDAVILEPVREAIPRKIESDRLEDSVRSQHHCADLQPAHQDSRHSKWRPKECDCRAREPGA
jgi:hypothetical protein